MISFAMSRKPEWQRGEHTVTLHMTLPEAVDWIYNHLDWYTPSGGKIVEQSVRSEAVMVGNRVRHIYRSTIVYRVF